MLALVKGRICELILFLGLRKELPTQIHERADPYN